MPTAQDWYTQQWQKQIAPMYGANKTTPYSDSAYTDMFTSGIKPLFGQSTFPGSLSNPNTGKFDLSKNNEYDIFDVSEFAKNPAQVGQNLFGFDLSNWKPEWDLNADERIDEGDFSAFSADPANWGQKLFGQSPYFEGSTPIYDPGGAVNLPEDAVTSRTRGDIAGMGNDVFNAFNNLRRYEYKPVQLPGVSTSYTPAGDVANPFGEIMGNANTLSNLATDWVQNRRGGLTDAEMSSTLQNPMAILQREQSKALEALQNRLADTGSYLSAQSPQFAEFASQEVLEPYGLQMQQLVSDATTKNLEMRAAEEESIRNWATQMLGLQGDIAGRGAQVDFSNRDNARGDAQTGMALDQLKNNLALAKSSEDRAGMTQATRDDLESTMLLQGLTDAERNFWLSEFDRAMQQEQFQAGLESDYTLEALRTGTLSNIFGGGSGTGSPTDLVNGDDGALAQFVINNPDADWEEILTWMKARDAGTGVNERPTRA